MTDQTTTAALAPAIEFAFRVPTDVTLTSVSFRKEFHGDDHRQAVDLGIAVDIQNSRLDQIIPGLREALYHNAAADSGQQLAPGIEAALPNLRFPRLNGSTFTLDDKKNKLAGYELGIEYGLGDERSNMLFDCCKVVKRKIECCEGGTVKLSFQVQYSGDRLDEHTCGKLALLEQDLIAIALIPPVVAQPQDSDNDESENPFGDDEEDDLPTGGPKTAEDLFVSTAEQTDAQRQDAALSSDDR